MPYYQIQSCGNPPAGSVIKLRSSQTHTALYWIEKYSLPNQLTKTAYYRQVFDKHIAKPFSGGKLDNTRRGHWIGVFEKIESRVMSHYMVALCKRAFRFCVNRQGVDTNPIEGLLPGNVGQKPKKSDRRLSDDELKVIYGWVNVNDG